MLTITSCNKFLEVSPKTEMPQEDLFKTEQGYKDALIGVYIQMKNNNAYGMSLTQTTIEYLVSSWDVTAGSSAQALGLFQYENTLALGSLESVYAQQYKIISSVNAILGKIDENKEVFKSNGIYETIKAECLAIRAYCHFDILRLFGPIPTAPENGNNLPYVTELSPKINPLIPYAQFKAAIIKDMTDAENLVNTIVDNEGNYPSDEFFTSRNLRLNLHSIKAFQARAYLWFGDHLLAYENAKFVIDAKNTNESSKYRLGTAADITATNYILTAEHVFGLYDFGMYDKFQSNYANGSLKKGSAVTTIKTQLFGNTGTDIRENGLWELITLSNAAKCYIQRKYQVKTNITTAANADFKQIPMIRLSEMYLIAAETAPFSEGLGYFKTFRDSRNIGLMDVPSNADMLGNEIIKEYRKEFYGEGQAFFAYKRVNSPTVLFAPASAKVNYLLPLPRTESISQN